MFNNIPIIGKKNEKLKELNDRAFLEYQKEMRKILTKWEIDNECFIIPRLNIINTPNSQQYFSVLEFHKLQPEELNEYKKQLNLEENKELIDKQDARNQSQ